MIADRAGRFPRRQFGFIATWANARPLLIGEFAALYAKHAPLDPISPLGEISKLQDMLVCPPLP